MKYQFDRFQTLGISTRYIQADSALSDIRVLLKRESERFDRWIFIDPTDDWLRKRIERTLRRVGSEYMFFDNPSFINNRSELGRFFKPEKKKFFQTAFYKAERKKRNILLDEHGQPIGGKWSYDQDNRKRFPSKATPPIVTWPQLDQFSLEKIIFIPAGNSWQKPNSATYANRFTMTQLLISNEKLFEISEVENNENQPTYTIDTLKKLNLKKEDTFFILGADAAIGISTWESYEKLGDYVQFLIAPRKKISENDLKKNFPFNYSLIIGNELDISSTTVRRMLLEKKEISSLIPKNIIEFIVSQSLY